MSEEMQAGTYVRRTVGAEESRLVIPPCTSLQPCTPMHLFPKLHISCSSLLISRLFQQIFPHRAMPEHFEEELSAFQQDVKAIDPKVLSTVMGGVNKPPEEPLLLNLEEGYRYFTTAVTRCSLKQYEFICKVCICELYCGVNV